MGWLGVGIPVTGWAMEAGVIGVAAVVVIVSPSCPGVIWNGRCPTMCSVSCAGMGGKPSPNRTPATAAVGTMAVEHLALAPEGVG